MAICSQHDERKEGTTTANLISFPFSGRAFVLREAYVALKWPFFLISNGSTVHIPFLCCEGEPLFIPLLSEDKTGRVR